jgi:hypothetical protein
MVEGVGWEVVRHASDRHASDSWIIHVNTAP